MYQKDYILRMIEQVGLLIAAILGLINKRDFKVAREELDNLYFDMLKRDAAFFRTIPVEHLTTDLMQAHNYTNGHLEILAELFNAEAELEYARGFKSASLEFSKKSLVLFEFIDKEMKTFFPERLTKMEAIRKRIGKLGEI